MKINQTPKRELMQEPWDCYQVATYLKLSSHAGYRTVRQWVKEGKLKCGYAGNFLRFRKEDVDDMVFSQSTRRR
jgi:excisionase family DNA binding protein